MKAAAGIVEFVDQGGGADGDGAHTWSEHVLVSTLLTRTRFWHHLLTHLD